MSTNVFSGESAHFLSYINDPTLPLVYSWAGEWLLALDNMHRLPEKKIWKSDWRTWKPQDDNSTEQDILHPCILDHRILFLSGTYSTSFTEKIWKGGTWEGTSATGDAWPEGTEGLILKHRSVPNSSKSEAKFASLWNENVVWMHCVHRSRRTCQALNLEMPPQHILPRGTRGTESIKSQLLWGLRLQQAPPSVTPCTTRALLARHSLTPKFEVFCSRGPRWILQAWLLDYGFLVSPRPFSFWQIWKPFLWYYSSFSTGNKPVAVSASWPGIKESKLLVRQHPRHRRLGWGCYFSKSNPFWH